MIRWYGAGKSDEKPDLFFEISNLIPMNLMGRGVHDYSRGEISLVRRQVITSLNAIGITQENFDPREHYIPQMKALNIAIDRHYEEKTRKKS